MNSAREIRKLAQSVRLTPGSDADQRILTAAQAALEQNATQASTQAMPLWKIIREARPSKLAIAAIIAITMILGVVLFEVSPDGASVAWAEMIKEMKQQPWIFQYFDNGSNISQWWLCPKEKISIHDYNGDVTFENNQTGMTQHYDKQTNTIELRQTVKTPHAVPFDDEQALNEIFKRPYQELADLRKRIEAGQYKPRISHGQYRGHEVQIQTYVSQDQRLNKNEDGSWLVIYIDTQNALLRGYTEWSHYYVGADPNNLEYIGVERGERAYDYPDPGPQSLYDVGVPRDAKVIKRHDGTFLQLLPRYQKHKQEGLKQIAAILVSYDTRLPELVTWVEKNNNPNGPISKLSEPLGPVAMEFDVFYFDDARYRIEHRFNLRENVSGSQNLIQNWPTCREELGESFASHLAWLQAHDKETLSSIKVNDGRSRLDLSRQNGQYRLRKRPAPAEDAHRHGDLGDRSWPELDVRSELFEDEYTKQHDLIGVKHRQRIKGHDKDDIFLYYLNPQKDYLCHKKVISWGHGSKQVYEVERYQQKNQKWYPQRIKYSGQQEGQDQLEDRECLLIHIDDAVDLPAGVFDVEAIEQLSKALQAQ